MKFRDNIRKNVLFGLIESMAVSLIMIRLIGFIVNPANYLIFRVILTVLLVVVLVLAERKRRENNNAELSDLPEKEVLERYSDRYSRRLLNSIMFTFLEVFSILLAVVSLYVNSKSYEVLETVNSNVFIVRVGVILVIWNALLLKRVNRIYAAEKKTEFNKALKIIGIGSVLYWAAAVGLFYVFEDIFVINILYAVRAVYIILIIAANIVLLKHFYYMKKKVYIPVLAGAVLAAAVLGGYNFLSRDVWMTQPYINSVPNLNENPSKIQYNEKTGVYTITKNTDDFKILHLTDIHLGGSVLSYDKDIKALKAVYKLIEETRPDLVVVTGDLVFPVGYASFSFNNTAPVQQFAAFMRNVGIPWAFTYGNHDTESYAHTSSKDLNTLYQSLSWNTSRTLLYPYVQPDIMGRSNQLIEIRNEDGTLNQALFLIDSNAYTGEGFNKYDYIHDDQVEWYEKNTKRLNQEAGEIVHSMIFFHIPLQQYKEAYELYEAGDSSVTYYFGEIGEEFMEAVCCSEYPSEIFDTALRLGSTTGFFCGHDHYNNISLGYKGVRLTYGMSIDYLAMPGIARDTEQRGGTLITVHQDGLSDIRQIPLESLK